MKVQPSMTAENQIIKSASHYKFANQKRFRYRLSNFIDYWLVQAFLAIALAATLFLPDIWIILNPSNEFDILLNGFLLVFFVAFSCEIIVT
jgi:hypothetical protein